MNVICFHNPNEENGYLSNWYPSRFIADGVTFSSMEQFMMYQKAACFRDKDSADKILETDDAARIKEMGRLVSGYDESYWNGVRQIIVYEGLAECAVKDKIWGIGLSMNDPDRFVAAKWKGKNLLGYALMMVRERL